MGAIHQAMMMTAGAAAPSVFDLTPYSPTLWLAGHAMTGFADGDGIGGTGDEWVNTGSAGGNWVQATANRRPSFQDAEVNGHPVVRFVNTPAGEEDRLTGLATSSYLSVSAYTVFVVFRATSTGSNHATLHRNQTLIGEGNGPNFAIVLKNGTIALAHNASAVSVQTAFSANTWYIVECWFGGGTMNLRLNGGTTVSAASPNLTALTGLTALAQSFGGSNYFDGDEAEIFATNTERNSTDRDAIRNGLGAYYGISV